MNRQERRRLEREVGKKALGQKILENALQCFYEAMRDNRIGEERAEKILQETVTRMGEVK